MRYEVNAVMCNRVLFATMGFKSMRSFQQFCFGDGVWRLARRNAVSYAGAWQDRVYSPRCGSGGDADDAGSVVRGGLRRDLPSCLSTGPWRGAQWKAGFGFMTTL